MSAGSILEAKNRGRADCTPASALQCSCLTSCLNVSHEKFLPSAAEKNPGGEQEQEKAGEGQEEAEKNLL